MQKECDLPHKLKLHGVDYEMRARGFWADRHYWCKVVCIVGGVHGVWLHNDLVNAGIATLVSTDLTTIGGQQPSTSWVMYSRAPTPKELVVVNEADAKIKRAMSRGSKVILDLPFSQVKAGVEDKKGEDLPDRSDMLVSKDQTILMLDSDSEEEALAIDTNNSEALALLDSEDETPLATTRQEDIATDEPGKMTDNLKEEAGKIMVNLNLNTKKVTKPKRKDVDACKKIIKATKVKQSRGKKNKLKAKVLALDNTGDKDKEEDTVNLESIEEATTKPIKVKGWKGWAIVDEEENDVTNSNGEHDLAKGDSDVDATGRRSRRNKRKRV
ncbi:hypothetical protein DFH28DRAFT_1003922 [Melampsora americana]|nr:hypothetical protein DFH28DRAFT_1003922 [Melampsora americana]